LINTTLDIAHDYREFVDTLGKIEAEYGRALSVAVRKLEGKLDAAVLPAPGSSKSPEPTLVKAMRAHLVETSAIAGLHVKRPGLFHDQLIQPLQQLERRVNETSRRLSLWSKDIRGRWDSGRERVETARYKYHASVRDHDIALTRFRSCPAPTGTGKNEGEWVRLERLAAEAELNRADRKRAYLVALAGEGREGGGGWDMNEGGGSWGWGEESRALYGYVEFTMLEIIKHHAAEDSSHTSLLCHIMERAEKCYSNVCIATDQNAFLDWNTTDRSAKAGASGSNSNSPLPSPADSQSSVTPERSTSSMSNGRPLSVLAPIKSARPSSLTDHQRSSLTPSPNGEYPALSCLSFVPPPSAKDETPTFGTDKRADRNWLLNRWLQSNAVVVELEGADGKGGTLARKRECHCESRRLTCSPGRDIQTLREKCVAMTGARGTGDAGEVWERRIAVQRGMGEDERKVAAAKAEKACLEVFLGREYPSSRAWLCGIG
jgi:hypothetical protein